MVCCGMRCHCPLIEGADYAIVGLHLTPDGYRVLFHEVMATIAKTWPDQLPENLPTVLPAWDDPDAWKDM